MGGFSQLATVFVTSEWEDFVMLAVPAAVVLVVTGAYLSSRNRIIAGLHYLMLSAIVLINLRLLAAGQWARTIFPTYGGGEPFVPETRLRIRFFGALAVDLAMLLALVSPLIAGRSRRLVRRIFKRGAPEPLQDASAACAMESRRGWFCHPIVRKSWFPLVVLGVWLLLMFGNPQWCRLIYMYQTCVNLKQPEPASDYTGRWRAYSLFGTLAADGWIKDGQKHGTWQFRSFHQKRTEDYKEGKLDGLCVIWNGRGVKEMEWHYTSGLTDGLCRDWWSNGNPLQEYTDKQGVHHGRFRRWDEDGKLLTDCIYRDGKIWSGVYHKSGYEWYEHYGWDLLVMDTYREGVKDGSAKVWVQEYGRPEEVLAEGTWKNGQPWEGTALTFEHPSTEECRYWVRTYREGKVRGPARLYAGSGVYSQIEDGTRVTLGPRGGDMVIIAEGDMEEIGLENGPSRVVPKGLWRFRDERRPETVIEGTYRNGEPWSGTFPRHGQQGCILDVCTFRDGQPQDGVHCVMSEGEEGEVVECLYQGGEAVGSPVTKRVGTTPLPLHLQK